MTPGAALHTEQAYAKINLTLHVTGRRADGYHLLDSIVTFAGIGDVLSFYAADATSLEITGPFAGALTAGPDNLVLRAANFLHQAFPGQIPTVRIVLEKHLPVASGIGGGSADAAAAIRGLCAIARLDDSTKKMQDLALRLGADVPVCLAGTACQMSGIGEILNPLDAMPRLPAVLVNPNLPVATAQVFTALGIAAGDVGFAPLEPDPPSLGESTRDAWTRWLKAGRNDLQQPACRISPVVTDCLGELAAQITCGLQRMSGSGATCFGLFDDVQMADAGAEAIKARHPGWWVASTVLG